MFNNSLVRLAGYYFAWYLGLCRYRISTLKRQDDNKQSNRPATQPWTDEARDSVHKIGCSFLPCF